MKLVMASENKGTVKLTKKEWQDMGEKAGWYKELMERGRAKEEKVEAKDVDPKELAMGKKIEEEHTVGGKKGKLPNGDSVEEKISLDHLAEDDPKYYTHLKEMEEKYGKE
jgi:hypothetical protein